MTFPTSYKVASSKSCDNTVNTAFRVVQNLSELVRSSEVCHGKGKRFAFNRDGDV